MTQNNHEQAVYALMSPAIMRAPNDPQLDGTPWPPSEQNIESAKVWATMALAYEQRTANLIALASSHRIIAGVSIAEVNKQIKERLGLE
jgi:hypothetical protein